MIQREWQRVDPRYLDEEEQRFWARIAGRQARFDDRVALFEKLSARAQQGGARAVPLHLRRREPEPPAAADGALRPGRRRPVDRMSFDDLVTLVTQAPPWEKDRVQGVRVLLRAIGEGKPDAPDQILARWTWRLARAVRKVLDRKASAEYPEAKRLLGALANSRGQRHEENAVKLGHAARELPIGTAAALLASADGYTPRANHHLEAAREEPRHHQRGRDRARRRPSGAEGASGPPSAPPPQEEAGGGCGSGRPGAGATPSRTADEPASREARPTNPVTTGQASASE